jgi:hypothetical protein
MWAQSVKHERQCTGAQIGASLTAFRSHTYGRQHGHQLRHVQILPDRAGVLGAFRMSPARCDMPSFGVKYPKKAAPASSVAVRV